MVINCPFEFTGQGPYRLKIVFLSNFFFFRIYDKKCGFRKHKNWGKDPYKSPPQFLAFLGLGRSGKPPLDSDHAECEGVLLVVQSCTCGTDKWCI